MDQGFKLCMLIALVSEAYSWVSPLAMSRSTALSSPSALSVGNKQKQLTGETLGDKYLLCKDSIESTSGKSNIYKAYRKCKGSGKPKGEQVVIKTSENHEALERELNNYDKVAAEFFVDIKEYLQPEDSECDILQDQGALVMECGVTDLKTYLEESGPLKGQELRKVARTAVECLRQMHQQGIVWTELKAENFVRMDCGTVKGIDLESAVPHKANPIDYSPKYCPPEFAIRFLCGAEPSMEMSYDFDVWALGMLFFELATGEHYFEDEDNDVKVCKELKNTSCIDLEGADIDPKLKHLISQCLHLEPEERPSIERILQHPYFMEH